MRTVAAMALALLLFPPASAADAREVAWSSASPLEMEGDLAVDAPGGIAQVEADHARGTFVLELGDGTVTVSTRRTAPLGTPLRAAPPLEGARDEDFEVHATRLVLEMDDDMVRLTLKAGEGGVVGVEGAGRSAGRPVRLAAAYDPYPAEETAAASPMRPPPRVDWAWEAGWLFCGAFLGASEEGFPVLPEPTLRARGPVEVMIVGGTASFRDANGTLQAFELGNTTDPESPPLARTQRETRLLFRGDVLDATIAPLGPRWGLAGPDVAWRVAGSVATDAATGAWRDERGTHAFEREPLRASGELVVALGEEDLAGPSAYRATGRFDALAVGTASVVAPRPQPDLAAPAAGLTLLGLLLLLATTGRFLLGKVVAPLYTRLSRSDILEHEARRRIYEAVSGEPGLQLGEVGRRAGLARGTLRFHASMLESAGFLRVRRDGPHLRVYPADATAGGASPVTNPVAQRILAALPPDGAALDLRELQARVGASRQLTSYHLKKLAAEGRVRVEGARPTLVARVRA